MGRCSNEEEGEIRVVYIVRHERRECVFYNYKKYWEWYSSITISYPMSKEPIGNLLHVISFFKKKKKTFFLYLRKIRSYRISVVPDFTIAVRKPLLYVAYNNNYTTIDTSYLFLCFNKLLFLCFCVLSSLTSQESCDSLLSSPSTSILVSQDAAQEVSNPVVLPIFTVVHAEQPSEGVGDQLANGLGAAQLTFTADLITSGSEPSPSLGACKRSARRKGGVSFSSHSVVGKQKSGSGSFMTTPKPMLKKTKAMAEAGVQPRLPQ
jgi:hypothetical protein